MNPIEIKRGDNFQKLSKYLLKGQSKPASPEQILSDITQQNSVFTRQDLARHLNKSIDDNTEMRNLMDKVLASKNTVVMQSNDGVDENVYFSTWEMVSLEKTMMDSAYNMAADYSHGVSLKHVEIALSDANDGLQREANSDLSEEQTEAVRYVTGRENISVVSGLAGAGKSTMLAAAREAWKAQGYTVYGAALAGKAAEGLQESSNIQSRTLASYEMGWKNGYGELSKGDVLVIDEAGMIGSRQLSRFIDATEKVGAKLVLVGDSEQLQAIGAGAPFRQGVEKLGATELENILRQKEIWQQEATKNLARDGTFEALQAYKDRGHVSFMDNQETAIDALVSDYLADLKHNPESTRLALAHRRVDVKEINQTIRNSRIEDGQLDQGISYKTLDGKRDFSVGDRLIFLENSRDLNVKNGMLGTIVDIQDGQIMTQIDGKENRLVTVSENLYDAIAHGYATTIHKSQGASVDRSFVMASYTMDRHLTYVAMSRHREAAQLYVNGDQFKSMASLATRLGREGVKKSTLDCTIDMTKSMRESVPTELEKKKVGWTQTYNLGNSSDAKAWIRMTATADSANELKEATAMANGEPFKKGKKTTKPVYHYSITWPEVDSPNEELQRLAVAESLKALGMEEYQALAVQHLDGKPHVHVMLNLIHPETGMSASTSVLQANGKTKASKLSYSHKKLRQWANQFEIEHGLQITEGSVKNEQKREAGETVHAHRKSRNKYVRDLSENSELDLSNFVYEQKEENKPSKEYTASKIGYIGKRLKKKHQLQYVKLNTAFKEKIQLLYQQKDDAMEKHKRKFSAQFKSNWTAVARANHKRMEEFEKSERYGTSTFFNSVTTYFQVKKERDSILKGLYAATSSKERRALIERWNKADFAQLGAREKVECAAYLDDKVVKVFDEKIDKTQSDYLQQDQRLGSAHAEQIRKLQKRWRNYSNARSVANREVQQEGYTATAEQRVDQSFGQAFEFNMSPD